MALPALSSEIVLDASAIEKTLKREVFDAKGRYHLVQSTVCAYAFLDTPRVSVSAGRVRIKSHLASQVAALVGGECVGTGDDVDVTVSGRPAFRADKLLIEDIQLDDVSDLSYKAPLEVFMKSAGPKVLELNLREAVQRMLKDVNKDYEVSLEKLQVTKLLAEDNKVRATLDFVLRAR